MRLTARQTLAICRIVPETAGPDARVRVFDSRLNVSNPGFRCAPSRLRRYARSSRRNQNSLNGARLPASATRKAAKYASRSGASAGSAGGKPNL